MVAQYEQKVSSMQQFQRNEQENYESQINLLTQQKNSLLADNRRLQKSTQQAVEAQREMEIQQQKLQEQLK